MPPPAEVSAAPAAVPARVHILLSTFNGAAWLGPQLDSFLAQSCRDWVLHWRDDGSSDATAEMLGAFATRAGAARCRHEAQIAAGNIGVLASYMGLLRAVVSDLSEIDTVAFADQDDIWLPGKLDRALVGLAWQKGPALYCARYVAVDEQRRRLGESARLHGPTAFPAALAQNVATGCTVAMNRAAARLVAASQPPEGTLHDWWCYLVTTAAGGRLVRDEAVVVEYRQHGGNVVGVAPDLARRAARAARRGPARFMSLLRAHVAALLATPELLGAEARASLGRIAPALAGGRLGRLGLLAQEPGLRRQTRWETAALLLWLLAG